MSELDKAREIEVSAAVRHKALVQFGHQIAEWDIALPAVEPLVLDFGLGRFESFGLIECWIANEMCAGYCGKYMFVLDGQTCPMHHHKNKHETFFLVEGAVRIVMDGKTLDLHRGDVLAVPLLAKHSFTGVGGPALLMELSQPCIIDDNFFEDTRIPIGGNYHGPNPVP